MITLLSFSHISESIADPALQQSRATDDDTGLKVYHLILAGLLGFLLGGFVCVGIFLYIQRFREAKIEEKNYKEHNYGTLTKHDSCINPNLYMSPSQCSMASSLNNKYYSTDSVGRAPKDPQKMTVKEATLKRNSLMRTNLSLNDL